MCDIVYCAHVKILILIRNTRKHLLKSNLLMVDVLKLVRASVVMGSDVWTQSINLLCLHCI